MAQLCRLGPPAAVQRQSHHAPLPTSHASQARLLVRIAARKQQQPSTRKKKKAARQIQNFKDDDLIEEEEVFVDYEGAVRATESRGMARAPDLSLVPEKEGEPYRVFAPPPESVAPSGSWSWGEDGDREQGPAPPSWNPESGFMQRAAELEDGGGWDRTSSSSSASRSSSSRSSGSTSRADGMSAAWDAEEGEGVSAEALPPVSKGQVLISCVGTTVSLTLVATFFRLYAEAQAPSTFGTDPALLADYLSVPSGIGSWSNLGLTLGAVGLVTGARLALMQVWPDFRDATNRSNKQVLTPLNWLDIMLITALTGVSEEFLFRAALMPATFLDWRGVLLSGVIFGALHNSGGRNIAFAGWATGIGCLYGSLFLISHNLWVPAAAHSLANFSSAAIWKTRSSSEK